MRLEHIHRGTLFAESELARPPRVLAWVAGLLGALLATAVAWAYVAQVERVVRARVRLRPST